MIVLFHGSHRSWHTFFKDFSRTFEVHFQGVFKDFSLFFQTSVRKKKRSTIDFSNKTYRDHLILSSPETWLGGYGYVFVTFLDYLLYNGYNTASNNSAWKGVWGSCPRKILSELVQNPAIVDNSRGYTLAWLLCHNKSRDCPFWNRLIHWNT